MNDPLRIVLVGAGSREFGPASIRDLLLSDALCDRDLSIVLVDIDPSELPRARAYAEAVAERLGRRVSVSATTDLEAALPGARAVVLAIEINRYFYWAQDFHVPRIFGSTQVYGENGGPGGLFHALRNMGPAVELARAMEVHCPEAWLVNYTNPLTKLCEAQSRLSSVRVVGLCHGVFHGTEQMARLLELPVERLDARASGLNHFSWFESVRDRETGEDLYPRLRRREREAHWLHDWDEIALSRILFRVFGRYPSPGANHIGEYLGWGREFLGSSLLQFFYDPVHGAPWETGETPTWLYNLGENPTDVPAFPESPLPRVRDEGDDLGGEDELGADGELTPSADLAPSGELAVPLLEGVLCGVDTHLHAVNVPNEGYVPGLPDGAVVEVPARADANGLHPAAMEPLPEGILGLLRTQTSINRLLVDAFADGARGTLLQALLLDPTTDSYRTAVHTINEMFRLQGDVLPEMEW
ncbi:MAG: alpha-galactosidase [Gemmatimonadales bacterium]|nr:alpha-galactosidase [Gemmatimonadales bacterium]MYG18695.1 alpha-galactosidase [Gemmatimonadales bacterium]